MKAHDIAGFFADDKCHMAYDLHTHGLTDAEISQALLKAVIGTWVILVEDGVIVIPIDPQPVRTIKERKPRDQRKAVPQPRVIKWPSRKFEKKPVDGR